METFTHQGKEYEITEDILLEIKRRLEQYNEHIRNVQIVSETKIVYETIAVENDLLAPSSEKWERVQQKPAFILKQSTAAEDVLEAVGASPL